MRFLVPTRAGIANDAVDRAYLANYESVPWAGRNRWEGNEFVVLRQERDSGHLHFPWYSKEHGPLVLSTATLVERDEPYVLALELARGTIYRFRQQIDDWLDQGLRGVEDARASLQEAAKTFARAITCQNDLDTCSAMAAEAIELALRVSADVVERYVDQVLEVRHRRIERFPTLLGVNLGSTCPGPQFADEIKTAFNSLVLPFRWRDAEALSDEYCWETADVQMAWADENRFRVVGGPLASLNQLSIPDWLYLWEGDRHGVMSQIGNYVARVAERYKGRVRLWNCAAMQRSDERLGLSEDDRLRILVTAVEALQSVDPKTPTMVCFDQPWSDWGFADDENSPWVLADALVRSDLELSAIGLEFNVGFQNGCATRDVMEVSRRLDGWGSLDLPLIVFLACPSSPEMGQALCGDEGIHDGLKDRVSADWQSKWAEDMSRLLLAKRFVHGIIWNQLSDAERHIFPSSGLFDDQRRPKPILRTLRNIRATHLA